MSIYSTIFYARTSYTYSFTLKVSIYMGYMYSYEGSVHDMIDAINTFVYSRYIIYTI